MRTSKTFRLKPLFLAFLGLSVAAISCNQSSTSAPSETDNVNPETAVLEMRPPGSIISKDTADKWVKAYRKAGNGPFATQVVIHHPDAVKFYMDSIFYKYTPQVKLPEGHVWRVAFTPMYNLGQKGGPKLSFCLVPCIVDTKSSRVYEFFNQMDSATAYYTNYYLPLYNKITVSQVKGLHSTDTSGGFVFDEGQLWP